MLALYEHFLYEPVVAVSCKRPLDELRLPRALIALRGAQERFALFEAVVVAKLRESDSCPTSAYLGQHLLCDPTTHAWESSSSMFHLRLLIGGHVMFSRPP